MAQEQSERARDHDDELMERTVAYVKANQSLPSGMALQHFGVTLTTWDAGRLVLASESGFRATFNLPEAGADVGKVELEFDPTNGVWREAATLRDAALMLAKLMAVLNDYPVAE